MSLRKMSLACLSAVVASSLFACAAPTADDAAAGDENAITDRSPVQCSSSEYAAGLALYKQAVDGAKTFLGGDVCEDGAMRWDVAESAARAVKACGQFEDVVATSPWAKPVRDALANNLALPALTGELRVRDASGRVAWTGLADVLPGKTMYGPAPGVYGNISKITFGEGGRATLAALDFETDDLPEWVETPATYRIGGIQADGSIEIVIEGQSGGPVEYYLYEVKPEGRSAPTFTLEAGEHAYFDSFPSECEA
jgi:hypothetical protein